MVLVRPLEPKDEQSGRVVGGREDERSSSVVLLRVAGVAGEDAWDGYAGDVKRVLFGVLHFAHGLVDGVAFASTEGHAATLSHWTGQTAAWIEWKKARLADTDGDNPDPWAESHRLRRSSSSPS